MKNGIVIKLFVNISCLAIFLSHSLIYAQDSTLLNKAQDMDKTQAQDGQNGLGLVWALRTMLENNSDILIQKQEVESSKGALQIQKGNFDNNLSISLNQAYLDTPISEYYRDYYESSSDRQDQTSFLVSLDKLYRSGVSITPKIQLDRIKAKGKYSKSAIGTINTDTADSAAVSFTVKVPILRGRGAEATGAQELAAEIDYKASEVSLLDKIAQSSLEVVRAYWNYKSAVEYESIYETSQRNAQEILENTNKLITYGQTPASERFQVEANLSSKKATVISSKQNVIAMRTSLGNAMGLKFEEITNLGVPIDDFPRYKDVELPNLDKESYYINKAIERRADLQYLKLKQRAAQILMNAAKKDLLPELNFAVETGYQSLVEKDTAESFFVPFTENARGPYAKASLTYTFPIKNNTKRGFLLQRKAEYEKLAITADSQIKTISSAVSEALNEVLNTSKQLIQASEAVSLYKEAVEKEIKKFQLGSSTLNDVIDIQDRLTNSMLNEIEAHKNYAIALANLRYQIGGFIISSKEAKDRNVYQNITGTSMEETKK
ncbi:outer membrane efflux protein [Candidatus Magnetoovum chiemensis]|nr:outer membrane efflux protein [Candidatus Magnetoovum chiemensis]